MFFFLLRVNREGISFILVMLSVNWEGIHDFVKGLGEGIKGLMMSS